jgi:hypothetical protein
MPTVAELDDKCRDKRRKDVVYNTLELMVTESRIREAVEFVEWLRQCIHERELPANNRVRAAGSCFAIAQEHHHSIVLLTEHRLYAPSFSLLRAAFEAYVRGLWLSRCARDAEVNRFLRGGEPPKVDLLLRAVEETPGFSENVLSHIKHQSWKAMCAFTHTGGLHVQRWNTAEAIEPNYEPQEVEAALKLSELIGAMSVIGFASLAGSDELALRVLEKIKSRTVR